MIDENLRKTNKTRRWLGVLTSRHYEENTYPIMRNPEKSDTEAK